MKKAPLSAYQNFADSAVVGKKMLCSSVIGGPAIISQSSSSMRDKFQMKIDQSYLYWCDLLPLTF